MSDAPKFENRLSMGNLITMITGIVALAVAWGTLQSDIRALAQRVDKGETRDDKAAETLDAMKSALIELRADSKATKAEVERMGRQLDRIVDNRGNQSPTFPKGIP
jgi:chromosome segregation ATPase